MKRMAEDTTLLDFLFQDIMTMLVQNHSERRCRDTGML